MPQFKPQVNYIDKRNEKRSGQYLSYRDIKRKMRYFLNDSIDGEVSVYRSRRGRGYEYFEKWRMIDNKPTIVKEGFQ